MRPVTKLELLREIAMDQHGFVTTVQAIEQGVSRAELSTMVSRGRLEHVSHGVYRVPQVPETEFDQYQRAVLWAGVPEACLSHDTALAASGFTDINPDRIHLTVGRPRRIRRGDGERYIVHRRDLEPSQRAWWQGVPITTLPTTIEDCIDSGVPSYLIRQALEKGGRTSFLLPTDNERLTRKLDQRNEEL